MSESPPSSPVAILTDTIAEAAERRVHQEVILRTPAQMAAEHEQRIVFHRLLDPGIMRPNPYQTAMNSLKTLLKIAENLLHEPDNPKFQRFKPTNSTIKRDLMDPKGTIEYAIALGFRAEVEKFQPYYVFNPRKMADLRIGAAILKDFVELEDKKREAAEQSKKAEKAAAEAAANKVKLAFFDDRKTKMMLDEMEKERRLAHASRAQTTSPKPTPKSVDGAGKPLADASFNADVVNGEDDGECNLNVN